MRLKTKYNIPLTIAEDKAIRDKAGEVDYNIPLGVEIIKNEKLDVRDNSAIAMFSMLHLHTVFITEESVGLEVTVRKIAHELVHRKDRLDYGFWKYCFMALPFLRERYLEPQARAIEKSLEMRYDVKQQAKIIRDGRRIKEELLKDNKSKADKNRLKGTKS